MLCYELRLERNRRGASGAVLQKLLAGREEVLAMPVLYLNSDEWRWEQQQLQEAVEAALGELDLSVPPDVSRADHPSSTRMRAMGRYPSQTAIRRGTGQRFSGRMTPASYRIWATTLQD